MGDTISYSSGKVPEENAEWLFAEGMAWQKQRIKELETEVERLREELRVERLGISHYSKGAHLSIDPSGAREPEERHD